MSIGRPNQPATLHLRDDSVWGDKGTEYTVRLIWEDPKWWDELSTPYVLASSLGMGIPGLLQSSGKHLADIPLSSASHQGQHFARLWRRAIPVYERSLTPDLVTANPGLSRFVCWSSETGELVKKTRTSASGRSVLQGLGVTFTGEKNRQYQAHRLAFAQSVVADVSSLVGDVSHLCHNAVCWRPSHLTLEAHNLNVTRNRCSGWVFLEATGQLICTCSCPSLLVCMRLTVIRSGGGMCFDPVHVPLRQVEM